MKHTISTVENTNPFQWVFKLSLVALLIVPTSINAMVIEGLCDGTANPAITCDTDTNLEWLDLTETQGMSVNQVLLSEFISLGFRYALEAEVEALWTHAGIPPPYPNFSAVSGVELLHQLMGITFTSVVGPRSQGIYNVGLDCSTKPIPQTDRACGARLARYTDPEIPIPVQAELQFTEVFFDEMNTEQGSYLVRTATSIPPTIVSIDIKPGNSPNCFNINSNGVIPVAILGAEDFDVTEIDTASLSFGGLDVRMRGNKGSLCSVEYINDDPYLDLICHFEDNSDMWVPGNGEATLIGNLLDGSSIEGSDTICVVP